MNADSAVERPKMRFAGHSLLLLLVPCIEMAWTASWARYMYIIPLLWHVTFPPMGRDRRSDALRIKCASGLLLAGILTANVAQMFAGINLSLEQVLMGVAGALIVSLMLYDGVTFSAGKHRAQETRDAGIHDAFLQTMQCRLDWTLAASLCGLVVMTSAFLLHEPTVLLLLLMLDWGVLRRCAMTAPYVGIATLVEAAYVALCVLPQSLDMETHARLTLATGLLFIATAIKRQWTDSLFSGRLSSPHPDDNDTLVAYLRESPNASFLLDRGWPFVVPLGTLLVGWSLALLPVPVAFRVALMALSGTLLLFPSSTLGGRIGAHKFVRGVLLSVALLHLHVWPTHAPVRCWIIAGVLAVLGAVESFDTVYLRIVSVSHGDWPSPSCELTLPWMFRHVGIVLQDGWRRLSHLGTAGTIALLVLLPMSDGSGKGEGIILSLFVRILRTALLAVLAAIAIAPLRIGQLLWFSPVALAIADQCAMLFEAKNDLSFGLSILLPPLSPALPRTLINLLTVVLAEMQLLRLTGSVFSGREAAETHSTLRPGSIRARILSRAKLICERGGMLLLLGTVLFYPQAVPVSVQTCFYSLWAASFVHIFYRSDLIVRLRNHFLRVLAVMAAGFFIFNWLVLQCPSSGLDQLLHATVFWLSCATLQAAGSISRDQQNRVTPGSEQSHVPPDAQSQDLEPGLSKHVPKRSTALIDAMERLFVVYWTRACALLAFLAASWSPSVLGVGHLLIGCVLVGRNMLSPHLYIPMILWVEGAIFLPAILPRVFQDNKELVRMLVGREDSLTGTILLTAWALILFLQPLFRRSLLKVTTEEERASALVRFQLFPARKHISDADPASSKIDSPGDSLRYYVSNWFVEFHDEIMLAALVVAAVSRRGVYGAVHAGLALLHFGWSGSPGMLLPGVSLALQVACLVSDYCLGFLRESSHLTPPALLSNPLLAQYLFPPAANAADGGVMFNTAIGAVFVCLTIRWMLTRVHCRTTIKTRRFDSHWCRHCSVNDENDSSPIAAAVTRHAFSQVKHAIHLYLGWAAHGTLLLTAVMALPRPTVPALLLLITAMLFFLHGEASLLRAKLRGRVAMTVAVLVGWVVLDAGFALVLILHPSLIRLAPLRGLLQYCGVAEGMLSGGTGSLTGVLGSGIFATRSARATLGATLFLLALQMRLQGSPAFSFLLAQLQASFQLARERGRRFDSIRRATIAQQQTTLSSAVNRVKKQLAAFRFINIDDWRQLHFAPRMSAAKPDASEDGGDSERTRVRRRNTSRSRASSASGYRSHLLQVSTEEFVSTDDESVDMESPERRRGSFEQPLAPLSPLAPLAPLAPPAPLSPPVPANLQLHTLHQLWRNVLKFMLWQSGELRRLKSRPSQKTSLRMLMQPGRWYQRGRLLAELLSDVAWANFDLVVDVLVLDAHMYHASVVSLLFVGALLLGCRLQRPFASRQLHNWLLFACAVWIVLNYCKMLLWTAPSAAIHASASIWSYTRHLVDLRETYSQSWGWGLLGVHRVASLEDETLRPTLLLLALAYKRSIMWRLGLWSFPAGDEKGGENIVMDEPTLAMTHAPATLDITPDTASDTSTSLDQSPVMALVDTEDNLSLSLSTAPLNETLPRGGPFRELLWPTTRMPWGDYYVPMFAADFVSLLLMMYYWGEFMIGPASAGAGSETADFLQEMLGQNMIPRSFVTMVLLCSFLLVGDRALYVSKNRTWKLVLQAATVIGFHVYVFLYLPHYHASSDLYRSAGLRAWYTCKWIYWISSALQLRHSYPPLCTETFLASTYNVLTMTLRTMYRTLPFITELRTVVDWTMSRSALGLWPWLKLADIYERLYAIQCGRRMQRSVYGNHRFGEAFPQGGKHMQGFVIVLFSVLLLWSPFVLLSRPSLMVPNELESMSLSLAIADHGPPFAVFSRSAFTPATEEEYARLRRMEGVNAVEVDPSYFTCTTLPTASETEWPVSADGRASALHSLRTDANASLVLAWRIRRKLPQSAPELTGTLRIPLVGSTRRQLADLLDPAFIPKHRRMEVRIDQLLPHVFRAPLNEPSTPLGPSRRGVWLVRTCTAPGQSAKTKWKGAYAKVFDDGKSRMSADSASAPLEPHRVHLQLLEEDAISPKSRILGRHRLQVPTLAIYSTRLPKYSFSSFNLVGLYATVVLTMAQLLRMMHADMTTRIPFDDLPNPAPLLALCQQLLVVRELGDFESEEAIYWQLIEIFRNPRLLIEMTKIE